jgi:hypothetical protein
MKKRDKVFFIIILMFSILITIRYFIRLNTIEESLYKYKYGSEKIQILHVEKSGKANIVLYTDDEFRYLASAIVKKTMGKHKVISSGVSGDIQLTMRKTELSSTLVRGIKDISQPILIGMVSSPEIIQVYVTGKESDKSIKAKIIEAKGERLWIVNLSGFEVVDFIITGIAADKEELVNKEYRSKYPMYIPEIPSNYK